MLKRITTTFQDTGDTDSYQKLPEREKTDSFKEQRIRTASHFNIFTEKQKTKEQCLQNSKKNIPTLKLLPNQTRSISTKH